MKSGKRNTLWICALVLPPALMVGIPSIIATAVGELFNLSDAIQVQHHAPGEMLFGVAYSSPDTPYKFARIQQERAEVLVIGSSRTLDLRREFFKPEHSFYNAGRLATHVWVTRQALERLPADALPETLILALDQYDFNASDSDYDPKRITPEVATKELTDEEDRWERMARVWPFVLQDLARGKIRPPDEGNIAHGIGMMATMQKSGFRKDGSYRYGALIAVPPAARSTETRLSHTFKRIEKSSGTFVYGDQLDAGAIGEVDRLLAWCAERKIQVIGYLPAYAPSIVAEMRKPPARFGYQDGLAGRLSESFAQHGYRIHDFTLVEGATDDEFIDGFHSAERVAGRMLLQMAEADPAAARIIDTERIRALMAASTDPFVLVP